MKWEDITSRYQGDTDRTPKTWQLKAGRLRITVTRHINLAANEWVLTCEPLFNQSVVGTGTADEAKQLAINAVRGALLNAAATLDA